MTDTTAKVGIGNLRRRVLVTLAALAAFRLASMIPLPAVDATALINPGVEMSGAWDRFSIAALGIIPWLSALTLAELAVLALPVSITHRLMDRGHANPFAWPVVALALAFASLQGYGVSVAMQQITGLVQPIDIPFTLVASLTLVAGTALTIAIAQIIQTRGVGFGFWVLFAALGVKDIAPNARHLLAGLDQGYPLLSILGIVVGTLAAMAAIVGLAMTRQRLGLTQLEPLVWPIQLAGLVVPWMAVIVSVVTSPFDSSDQPQTILMLHQPVGLAMLVVAVTGISYLYARRENSIGLWVPTAGVLVLLSIASVAALQSVPTLLLTAGNVVIVATVAYVVLTGFRQAGAMNR